MRTLLLAFLAACVFSAPAISETILVHAGTLLAVPGSDPVSERTLVIRDGKIAEIRDGFVSSLPGEEAALIDLSDRFVMPGFIDLHVHLTGQSGDNSRNERITKSDAHASLRAAMYAKRTLMAGFTTVRNLGSRGEAMFALRDAIADGHVPGPKILVAGYSITPTGGHADVHGYRAEISEVLASSGVCDGPDDCRRAVRLQVKRGADVIKVTATGGVLSNTPAPGNSSPTMSFEPSLRRRTRSGGRSPLMRTTSPGSTPHSVLVSIRSSTRCGRTPRR